MKAGAGQCPVEGPPKVARSQWSALTRRSRHRQPGEGPPRPEGTESAVRRRQRFAAGLGAGTRAGQAPTSPSTPVWPDLTGAGDRR